MQDDAHRLMTQKSFADRAVVITGGAGGIGMACARLFLAQGARVHLVDVDAQRLASARDELASPGAVTMFASSLDSPVACREAIASANCAVEALVHMAGVFEPDALDADDRSVWERAIASNLTNAYDMSIAFRAQLQQDRDGAIVLCSSRAFQRGAPGRAAYAAAKGGIVGLARTFSREFAPRIRVNAIAPGLIVTRMTESLVAHMGPQRLAEIPLGRFGTPQDVAHVALFLCSDGASYVTGQLLTVDGGTLNSS
jgi:3-oxoacyl-[acyl-carrier protein] reductase